MKKSEQKPKSKFLHFFLLTQFVGLCLLGGHAYFQQEQSASSLENAAQFQKDYLASIRNSIDLGKGLNSYSDIIYEEVKNPRGRDVQIFAQKAKASSELVFNSSILTSSKRKDLRASFDQVMAKGEAVLKRLKKGDSEVAREVFEKDFSGSLKSFHLNLDSHKKYVQHQASRFFSRKFLGGAEQSGLGKDLPYIFIALCLFSLSGIFFSLRSQLKNLRSELLFKDKEKGQIADELYDRTQMVEEMRVLCEKALCAPPRKKKEGGLKDAGAPDANLAKERLECLSKNAHAGLDQLAHEQAKSGDVLKEIIKEVENNLNQLEALNNFKRNILNLQISGKGDFAGSEEFLASLMKLEKGLLRLSDLSASFSGPDIVAFIEEFDESLSSVSLAMDLSLKERSEYSKELVSRYNEGIHHLESRLNELETWAKARNEWLATALVVSDPVEKQEKNPPKAA